MKVLIVYYSLTGRSGEIAETLKKDLEEKGEQVSVVSLEPDPPVVTPIKLLRIQVLVAHALFNMERKVRPLPTTVYEDRHDLLILIGPSWGFTVTPPMAYFARHLLPGIDLSPDAKAAAVITCRRYWRRHLRNLGRLLKRSGLAITEHLALEHQGREPFRLLVLKARLAEKDPPLRWIPGRFYPPFGFSEEQVKELHSLASRIVNEERAGLV